MKIKENEKKKIKQNRRRKGYFDDYHRHMKSMAERLIVNQQNVVEELDDIWAYSRIHVTNAKQYIELIHLNGSKKIF